MSRFGILAFLVSLIALMTLLATPSLLHSRRSSQFQSVCQIVSQNGGSLSLDLHGDYWLQLEGHAASEESLHKLLPLLENLPTGFTFIGPGEGRHFYVSLNNSDISANGLTRLCGLSITSLMLSDCYNLHDDAVDAILTLKNPDAIVDGDIRLSPEALRRLRSQMSNAFPH